MAYISLGWMSLDAQPGNCSVGREVKYDSLRYMCMRSLFVTGNPRFTTLQCGRIPKDYQDLRRSHED